MSVTALVVAAGSGARMGGGLPKQFRPLAGRPLLSHAIEPLVAHPRIDRVVVVVAPGQDEQARTLVRNDDVAILAAGGATRWESVGNGLDRIDSDFVLVHDAARPFCPPGVIDSLIDLLESGASAAVPVLPIADTLAGAGPILGDAVDRDRVVRVQTPQAFDTHLLRRAVRGWREKTSPTDEATAARAIGAEVRTVQGHAMLDKLTTMEDWARAEDWLSARLEARTGMGFDVHAFAGDGPVIIGGLTIDHDRGLSGHSDADVALHAITDAVLGAASLGDIGEHFPPTDPRWKGASSDIFLDHAARLVRERGGRIDHVDCTIICEAPKIGPHRAAMRSSIAKILALREDQVSIKATTTERLGFTGRGEGIAAQAVATVRMPRP